MSIRPFHFSLLSLASILPKILQVCTRKQTLQESDGCPVDRHRRARQYWGYGWREFYLARRKNGLSCGNWRR